MGHRDLLVTPTYMSAVRQPPLRTSHAQRPPLGGYVLTRKPDKSKWAQNHFSGNATNQDLASQNVSTSLLTQNNFRFARHSGTIATNVHKSDLRTAPTCVRGFRRPYTFMRACSKEGSPVICANDYSYLKATIGSTRIARRAGM